jgi:hypothetical protein
MCKWCGLADKPLLLLVYPSLCYALASSSGWPRRAHYLAYARAFPAGLSNTAARYAVPGRSLGGLRSPQRAEVSTISVKSRLSPLPRRRLAEAVDHAARLGQVDAGGLRLGEHRIHIHSVGDAGGGP